MRPQQQNRRMRGRNNNNNGGGGNNNNNRRGPNPLTRNYESNGPDVKIRGSAHQIAEKYSALARDAHSSGDRVMAENYLQHAEHYIRIIMAAQAQMPQQFRDESDEDGEDERDEFDMPVAQQPQQSNQHQQRQHDSRQHDNRQNDGRANEHRQNEGRNNEGRQNEPRQNGIRPVQDGTGPQPIIEGMPAEVALERGGFNGNAVNGDERPRGDFNNQGRGDRNREDNREPRAEAPAADANGASLDEGGDLPRRNRRPRRGPRRDEQGPIVDSGNPADIAAAVAAAEPNPAEPALITAPE